MIFTMLEWTGTVVGITGTVLLASKAASKRKVRLASFLLYLVSNTCMMAAAAHAQLWGFMTTQAVFLGLTIMGVFNNWKEEGR